MKTYQHLIRDVNVLVKRLVFIDSIKTEPPKAEHYEKHKINLIKNTTRPKA